jgi:hypothetical protein
MSFPEITNQYTFKEGKACFEKGYYKAARNYLRICAISEDLTFVQRQEARIILEKIQTNV